jgi:hypothetical protein
VPWALRKLATENRSPTSLDVNGEPPGYRRFVPADEGRYRAAIELIRMEGEHLFSTFAAFLVAQAVLAGFLANIAAGSGHSEVLILGAVAGLLICFLWLAAYERRCSYYEFRFAQADDAEPAGWNLLQARGKSFSDGEPVFIRGRRYQMKGAARLKARHAMRILIAVFFAGYLVFLVVGIRRGGGDAPLIRLPTHASVGKHG